MSEPLSAASEQPKPIMDMDICERQKKARQRLGKFSREALARQLSQQSFLLFAKDEAEFDRRLEQLVKDVASWEDLAKSARAVERLNKRMEERLNRVEKGLAHLERTRRKLAAKYGIELKAES